MGLEHIHNYYRTDYMNNHMTNGMIIIRQAKVYKYHVNNKILSCSTLVV